MSEEIVPTDAWIHYLEEFLTKANQSLTEDYPKKEYGYYTIKAFLEKLEEKLR